MDIATIKGKTMGGLFRLRLPEKQNRSDIQTLVQTCLNQIENQMSAWVDSSVLNKINHTRSGQWINLPKEMVEVIKLGFELQKATNGALNVGMGHITRQLGFGPDEPDANTPQFLPQSTGGFEFDASNRRIRKNLEVELDLNSIAKGYAVDQVCENLSAAGVSDYLFEAAGDIRGKGLRPDKMPWTVALELPVPEKIVPNRLVPLIDMAVATSGNYRRFIKQKNQIFGHVLNPSTGQSVLQQFSSVAVLSNKSAQADGLATALFVMGPEVGFEFAKKESIAACFTYRQGEGFKEEMTETFHQAIDLKKP